MLFRRRIAASEAIGTILAISLTLIIGTALFGFVNSQAGTSESQINNAAQGDVSNLQERFVVAQVVYTSNSVTVDIYNNGQTIDNIVQMVLYNSTAQKIDISYDANYVTNLNNPTCKQSASSLESPLLGTSPSSFSLRTGSISSIKLTLPSCYTGSLETGATYYVQVLGQYGNSATYFQKM